MPVARSDPVTPVYVYAIEFDPDVVEEVDAEERGGNEDNPLHLVLDAAMGGIDWNTAMMHFAFEFLGTLVGGLVGTLIFTWARSLMEEVSSSDVSVHVVLSIVNATIEASCPLQSVNILLHV